MTWKLIATYGLGRNTIENTRIRDKRQDPEVPGRGLSAGYRRKNDKNGIGLSPPPPAFPEGNPADGSTGVPGLRCIVMIK